MYLKRMHPGAVGWDVPGTLVRTHWSLVLFTVLWPCCSLGVCLLCYWQRSVEISSWNWDDFSSVSFCFSYFEAVLGAHTFRMAAFLMNWPFFCCPFLSLINTSCCEICFLWYLFWSQLYLVLSRHCSFLLIGVYIYIFFLNHLHCFNLSACLCLKSVSYKQHSFWAFLFFNLFW